MKEPLNPITHKDGTLMTPVSQALRAATRRAGGTATRTGR